MVKDMCKSAGKWVRNYLILPPKVMADVLVVMLLPFSFAVGHRWAIDRDVSFLIVACAVVIVWLVCIVALRWTAKYYGVDDDLPVPNERFTEVEKGEVSIDKARLQELILYVAELEDWVEKGKENENKH